MKNSFIHGAVILMSANIISKVLGAFLKIPLTYIMHEEGMAIYNTAFGVYAMVLAFVISGVPFAVSKLSAEELAEGNRGGAKAVVGYSSVILAVLGAAGTALMWFFADFFAAAMKEMRAAAAIRAIAPSVLLVAMGDAAKSGFQGEGNMMPTALSQCIEAVIKLFAGYLLARIFIQYSTENAAAGAVFGVTVGEFAATVMLTVSYIILHRRIKKDGKNGVYYGRKITAEALPVLFIAVTGSALSTVDTSLIRGGLLRSGLSETEARYLFGSYTGYAMTVLNLPPGFLGALGVSVIPAISAAAARGDGKRVIKLVVNGLGICTVCAVTAAVTIAVFGEMILGILFRNTASAPMLRMAAPSVLFLSVMQFTGAVLQALGYSEKAFLSSAVSGGIKILAALFLVPVPYINIYGAAIGSDVAFFAGAVLNFIFLSTARDLQKRQKSDIM